jgi:hypothetical protein
VQAFATVTLRDAEVVDAAGDVEEAFGAEIEAGAGSSCEGESERGG